MRNLELLADWRGFQRTDGRDFAKNRHHPVPRDEFLDGGSGLAVLGLVVLGEQLELAPEHAACGIDFLYGE